MIVYTFSFYLFSTIAVLSALMVISSKNSVHSVLFLILSFVNAAGLFVLLGAEFLAMILLVVYVGAVAVLFLFVVMMLNVAQQNNPLINSAEDFSHIPVGLIISLIIFFELIFLTNLLVILQSLLIMHFPLVVIINFLNVAIRFFLVL